MTTASFVHVISRPRILVLSVDAVLPSRCIHTHVCAVHGGFPDLGPEMFVSSRSYGRNRKMSTIAYLNARSGFRNLLFGLKLAAFEIWISSLAGLAEGKRCGEIACDVSH